MEKKNTTIICVIDGGNLIAAYQVRRKTPCFSNGDIRRD